jgi:hypothetical protein
MNKASRNLSNTLEYSLTFQSGSIIGIVLSQCRSATLLKMINIPKIITTKILNSCYVNRGVQLHEAVRLFRGVNSTSGRNSADYGQGYYFTDNWWVASEHAHLPDGKVINVSRELLPNNALRFDGRDHFDKWMWEIRVMMGYDIDRGLFKITYPNFADFIHALDPNIDGIQMHTGGSNGFVNYKVPRFVNYNVSTVVY